MKYQYMYFNKSIEDTDWQDRFKYDHLKLKGKVIRMGIKGETYTLFYMKERGASQDWNVFNNEHHLLGTLVNMNKGNII